MITTIMVFFLSGCPMCSHIVTAPNIAECEKQGRKLIANNSITDYVCTKVCTMREHDIIAGALYTDTR